MKKKLLLAACLLGLVSGLIATQAYSEGDRTVSIRVAPGTIALNSKGTWVTVHAGIRYAVVDAGTVELNGISARLCFADDRGNLVAKFTLEAIKEIVEPPTATLTLSGATKDGEAFSGSETVKVKD